MSGGHSLTNPFYKFWKLKILPGIMVFNLLAMQGGSLTMDNLCRHRKFIVNEFRVCLMDEKSIDHLLLNCKVTQGLWSKVLNWFYCSWALPRFVCGLFEVWLLEV